MSYSKPHMRSKRQFLGSNVRGVYGFRTRTHGTTKQIGTKFPILSPKQLPKLNVPKYRSKSFVSMTPLERETQQMERELTEAGFKAYTIGIKMKSGETIEIPCICKSWAEAMQKAHKRMLELDISQVDEITIVDPSISEVLHKVAGGARKAFGAIKAGIMKLGRFVKREAKAAAHEAGRIMAAPAEIREEYQRGLAERPGQQVQEVPTPEVHVPVTTMAEYRAAPTPRIYKTKVEPEPGRAYTSVTSVKPTIGGGSETRETLRYHYHDSPGRILAYRKPYQSRVPWSAEPVYEKTSSMIEAEQEAVRRARWAHRVPVY